MSRKERDKKRSKKKKIRTFFIAFVFIYLIFRSVPALHASTLKTAIVEEGILEDKVKLKGLIIKDERVYSSEGEGKIKLYKKEGERVKLGTKVAQISLIDNNSSLKDELKEVNKKIDSIEKIRKEKKTMESDKDKVNKNANEVLDDIQDSINYENYEKVSDLKEELYVSLGKQKNIDGKNTLASQTLENLKKEKERLTKEIANNTINYISKESGIVSYKIDGIENLYSTQNVLNYDIDDVKKLESQINIKTIKDGAKVNVKDTLFKIVDNHNWYILVQVDNIKTISPLKEGDNINVFIDNDDQKVKGKILKINKKGRQAVMVINFNSFFHDHYDKRIVDVELVKSRHEGLKVPIKSISEKDGIKGVYIKDISGIIKFRPIEILGKNEEYAIISSGDKNNNINIKGSDEVVKTVKLFDEILLNNGKIKEGQIVDWQQGGDLN